MTQKPAPAPEPKQKKAKKAGLATIVVHHSITFLILVLMLGLGVWSYLNFQNADFFASMDRTELNERLKPPLAEAQRQRIEVALEVWALIYGRHPAYLDEMVEEGLLLPSDLYYPSDHYRWTYERHSDGFTLRPGAAEEADGEPPHS